MITTVGSRIGPIIGPTIGSVIDPQNCLEGKKLSLSALNIPGDFGQIPGHLGISSPPLGDSECARAGSLSFSLSLPYQPALHSEQSLHYKHIICVRPCARYQRVGVHGGHDGRKWVFAFRECPAEWDQPETETCLRMSQSCPGDWAWEGQAESAQDDSNRDGGDSGPGRYLEGRNYRI